MISQTAEYALRAVVHLAMKGVDESASAQEISQVVRVQVGYLQKILRMLAKADILKAQRGSGGGFSLAKVPSAVSVLDVLKASESAPARISKCPLGIKGHTRLCTLHRLLDDQMARAEQVFASTSIADLLEQGPAARPLCETLSRPSQAVPLRIDLPGRPTGTSEK